MLDEELLIRQAKEGDPNAFAQLYERYFDRVYRYIYFRLGKGEAEDLTQEVFLKAFQSLGSYKWRGLPFSSWLMRITHNLVIDHIRVEGKRKQRTLASLNEGIVQGGTDPALLAEHKLAVGELSRAMEKLSPAQREVLSLRFGSGLSVSETAKALKKSEGTVKSLQFQAITSLKRILYDKEA